MSITVLKEVQVHNCSHCPYSLREHENIWCYHPRKTEPLMLGDWYKIPDNCPMKGQSTKVKFSFPIISK